jgi:putative addiction module component (TIGR02574 family)
MTDIALRLKDELLRLPDDDREALAHVLWESLGESIAEEPDSEDEAWIAELDRRSAEADAGLANEEPFRDVIAELRRERP